MNIDTKGSGAQKAYRPSLAWRISPLLIMLPLVAFLWLLLYWISSATSSSSEDNAWLFPFILLLSSGFLILGALLCLTTLNTRIVTTPEGMTYYQAGLCLYSPWQNIVGLDTIAIGGRSVESLRLRFEAVEGMSLEEGRQERIAVMTKAPALQATENALPVLRALVLILNVIALLGGGRYQSTRPFSSSRINPQYIPVGLFGVQWKYGELRQVVQSYAPKALA